MSFEININGIDVKLNIRNYKLDNREEFSDWCRCDFSLTSGDWLKYQVKDDELLLSSEVDDLEENFTLLLDKKLTNIIEKPCIEPDFCFILHPQKDLRQDPKYTYVAPGYEIEDIYLEWRIYFWNDGLTDNFLNLRFNRYEIMQLRDYLSDVRNSFFFKR